MITKTHIFAVLFLLTEVLTQVGQRCCKTFDQTNTICLTCPTGSILNGNTCIINIDGCLNYLNCYSCSACSVGYKLVNDKFNGQAVSTCQ